MGGGRWGGGDGRSRIDQDGRGVSEWRSSGIEDECEKKRRSAQTLENEEGLLRWRLQRGGKSCVSAPPADPAAPWQVTTSCEMNG